MLPASVACGSEQPNGQEKAKLRAVHTHQLDQLPTTVRESLPAGSHVVGRPLPWAVSLEVDDLPARF